MPPPRAVPFLICVPLTWAIVLLFHPAPDPRHIHASLADQTTRWLVVHGLTVVFIGLMGAALYLLVRHLPGTAARIAGVGAEAFALFYGAGEAILGIATGVLVRHGQPAAAQVLWDDFLSGDLLLLIGSVAWIVAVLAAALAVRQAGAAPAVSLLLVLSASVVLHGPPIGPMALLHRGGRAPGALAAPGGNSGVAEVISDAPGAAEAAAARLIDLTLDGVFRLIKIPRSSMS